MHLQHDTKAAVWLGAATALIVLPIAYFLSARTSAYFGLFGAVACMLRVVRPGWFTVTEHAPLVSLPNVKVFPRVRAEEIVQRESIAAYVIAFMAVAVTTIAADTVHSRIPILFHDYVAAVPRPDVIPTPAIPPPEVPPVKKQSGAALTRVNPPKAITSSEETPKPDLILDFFGTDRVAFCIGNQGKETASGPKYTTVMLDLTNQWHAPPQFQDRMPGIQPLPIPTVLVNDFVRPNECLGNFAVITDEAKQFVKSGDRLFGMIWITCAQCKLTRTYWVSYEAWKVGWYSYNTTGRDMPDFIRNNLTAEEADKMVSEYIPAIERIMIPPTTTRGFWTKPH